MTDSTALENKPHSSIYEDKWSEAVRRDLKNQTEYYGVNFYRHYILPRGVGTTTFIAKFADERAREGLKVMIVTRRPDIFRHEYRPYVDQRILFDSIYDSHDIHKFRGYKMFDWILMDTLQLSPGADSELKYMLPTITKNYIRIDSI